MGPRARDVLTQVTHADLSNAAFPFGAWREIDIAGALVRALRVTYVGELGWELHIPVESALVVYERLMEAGRQHGIVNAGYRAIESLRLEKGTGPGAAISARTTRRSRRDWRGRSSSPRARSWDVTRCWRSSHTH